MKKKSNIKLILVGVLVAAVAGVIAPDMQEKIQAPIRKALGKQ